VKVTDVDSPLQPPLPHITKEYLLVCPAAKKRIDALWEKKLKWKHEILDTEDVAFVMIGTNASDVRRAIDGIRSKRQKFICLNDNMNHSNPESRSVVKVLHQFYESFFPIPSAFELPAGQHNKYLHVDDYEKVQDSLGEKKKTVNNLVVVYIFILVGCLACCRIFCKGVPIGGFDDFSPKKPVGKSRDD